MNKPTRKQTRTEFGRLLSKKRVDGEITLGEMAESVYTTSSKLSNVERGKSYFDIDTYLRLYNRYFSSDEMSEFIDTMSVDLDRIELRTNDLHIEHLKLVVNLIFNMDNLGFSELDSINSIIRNSRKVSEEALDHVRSNS